jgi:hypothetical protein
MLDSDGSLRCDRLQFRVHQRIAGNMRRRIENDRHDLQSGFSLQLLFFHGQHRVPHTLCQMKQHALDGSRESVLADGMFQKVPTIPGYVVERRNREWLPETASCIHQGHAVSSEASVYVPKIGIRKERVW